MHIVSIFKIMNLYPSIIFGSTNQIRIYRFIQRPPPGSPPIAQIRILIIVMIIVVSVLYARVGLGSLEKIGQHVRCGFVKGLCHPLDASCAQVPQVNGPSQPTWGNFRSIAEHVGLASSILRPPLGLRDSNRSATSTTAHS